MPLQFNQTKKHLSWEAGGRKFSCEPWESVDVPAELVAPIRKMGVPIGSSPVAPEIRAARRVEDEATAASDSAFVAVKKRADEAEAAAKSAAQSVDLMQAKLDEQADVIRKLEANAFELEKKLAVALSDKDAAESLLSETSRQATVAEERALKAEALLEESKSKPKQQSKKS